MLLLLQYTLIFASVLLLVALGGCFSEHSGVINIGLEGIMVMGALGGALMMKFLPAGTSAFVVVLLTVLASILLGMIYSLLLAVEAVNFKADQTLVGTAMNLLGTAAATVVVKAMNTAADPDNVSSTIQVQQMVVRDEQDIRSLAVEIATLTRRQQRGKGMRFAL